MPIRYDKCLTYPQHYTIDRLLRNGSSQKEIAEIIVVHPSTISRELRRAGMNRENYHHLPAQKDADSHERSGYLADS